MMTVFGTVALQACLDRLKQGDDAARKELLAVASCRLEQLGRVMLKSYPGLRRWEQTGDVVQNALIRLDRALRSVTPESPLQFHRLAALQVRRELIDLARHYFGAEGPGRAHQSNAPRTSSQRDSPTPAYEAADVSGEPSRLAAWTEFHQKADELPDEEREVFDLVWYQGLSYGEAAEVLKVSAKTVMRRYQAARLRLHDAVAGRLPE
jgi:RNA polymerase sigma-70 factor (ECF subfamily)